MDNDNYFIPLLLYHFRLLGIKCNSRQLDLVLQSSPSYPSLLSIMQTYSYFGLKANAFRADFIALKKLSLPVLVQINNGDSHKFVLVCTISDTNLSYYDVSIAKEIVTSPDDFCAVWTGVLVHAERVEQVCNKISNETLSKVKKYVVVAFVFLSLFLLSVVNVRELNPLLFFWGLLILKCTGLWFTIGLLRQESGGSYSSFDAICHRVEAFDCKGVVQSKGAKIFNQIALADIGFVFFVTSIIFLFFGLFFNTINPVLSILFTLALCSSPFILFSIIYQKFFVKKWCPLCLGVVATLLIELVYLVFLYDLVFPEKILLVTLSFSVSFFISLLILFYEKHRLLNVTKAFSNEVAVMRLKRSPIVMNTLFQKQNLFLGSESQNLIMGDNNAPIKITSLLSPMCTPCKKLATDLVRLLNQYPTLIQWHLRLDGFESQDYLSENEIPLQIIELFKQNTDTESRLEIVKNWFQSQSLEVFHRKYPAKTIMDDSLNYFLEHVKENKRMEIQKVPTVWINKFEYPEEYSFKDIPFLLTDLNNLLKSTM